MKRLCTIVLAVLLIMPLYGCESQENTVQFFYLRSEYISGAEDGIISPEDREITSDRGLNYLLRLYLEGPVSSELISPFPSGLYLLNSQLEDNTLLLVLSRELCSLQNIDLTLALGCLARTGFSLTDAEHIQINSTADDEHLSVSLHRDSFVLLDEGIPPDSTK